jgi:hypothetical protein
MPGLPCFELFHGRRPVYRPLSAMASSTWNYPGFLDHRINTLESLSYYLESRATLDLADADCEFLLKELTKNVVEDLATDPIQH